MDIKESNIYFDEKNQMYKIDLGFYTRFFDYIIFAQLGSIREFGKENIQVSDFKVDENIIFGSSDFFGGKIINIFYFDRFEDIYRIVQDAILVSFCIKGTNYFILSFLDLKENIGYYSNFKDSFYDIVIEKNTLKIINNKVDTIVFEKKLCFINFKNKYPKYNYVGSSIFDVFFLENIFSPYKNKNLIQDLLLLNNTLFIIEDDFGILKFGVFYFNQAKEIKKLFLSLNNNQVLVYLPKNKNIKNLLNEFEDISKLEIGKFSLDLKIPENIFEYDQKFLEFQKNVIKFQYILYSLKASYKQILGIGAGGSNSYIQLSQKRLQFTKENLEKNIKDYENIYNKLLKELAKFNFLKI